MMIQRTNAFELACTTMNITYFTKDCTMKNELAFRPSFSRGVLSFLCTGRLLIANHLISWKYEIGSGYIKKSMTFDQWCESQRFRWDEG